jgi:hypothetical protein
MTKQHGAAANALRELRKIKPLIFPSILRRQPFRGAGKFEVVEKSIFI